MLDIHYAMKIAREYYDDNTFYHAMRVADYATNNILIPECKRDNCLILAIIHDLLEDTNFEFETNYLSKDDYYIYECLELLTKNKDNTYEDYLKNIKEKYDTHPEAYWVKLADMKDHLNQKETLNEKLKDKYINSISELM